MLSFVDYSIIVGFLVVSLLLGFRLGRHVKPDGHDYFLGDGVYPFGPLWLVIMRQG